MDQIPTKSSLLDLLNLSKRQPVVVSIYTPTHPASNSQTISQDRVRFKNALQKAQDELKNKGIRLSVRRSVLDSAWELYENLDFWQHLGQALAVFLTPDELKWYRLPIEADELVCVDSKFVLAPMAVAANLPGYHYVLKLDLKHPKVFLASWYMFEEINLRDMPAMMEEALNISGYEQEQQFQTMGNSRQKAGGKGDAVYHGHGGAKDNRSSMVENYLRMVDAATTSDSLKYPDAPFILVGTSRHLATFKSLSRKNIIHTIDKDFSDETKLQEQAMEYLSGQLEADARRLDLETENGNGAVHGNYSLEQLLSMASRGQIKLLGVGLLSYTRDSVRNVKNEITKLDLHADKDWLDKVERVVNYVIRNGGEISGVYLKDGKHRLEAVLRYQT